LQHLQLRRAEALLICPGRPFSTRPRRTAAASQHGCNIRASSLAPVLRVQCDFQYRSPQNEWPTAFNGDGHVSAFRFANRSVDFMGVGGTKAGTASAGRTATASS
jgi:hypothetical protein